jgi:hypothetical protein
MTSKNLGSLFVFTMLGYIPHLLDLDKHPVYCAIRKEASSLRDSVPENKPPIVALVLEKVMNDIVDQTAIKSRGLYKAEVLSLYDNVINKMQIVKTRHCLSSLEFWRTIVSEWEPPNI